jgi:ATP-binding cassette, subfamily B, multidrug efflux pump
MTPSNLGHRRPLFRWIEGLTDPFGPHPDETPPKQLWPFYRSHVAPFRKVLAVAALVGTGVALTELALIYYAGRLVDLMNATPPGEFWRMHGLEVLGAALLILVLRPVLIAINAAVLFSGISTNMQTQAHWRSHRHMLGQPVGFFHNDFAGRLANRVMNMGPAMEDSVFLVFEAFWQAAAFAAATLILLGGMDWRLALPLVLWIAVFVSFVLWYAPKAGTASEKHSHAKSRVTGRVVDGYTNIETVKLFAHAEREEAFARTAMARQRLRFAALMRLFATMHGVLGVFNAAAIFLVVGPALWLWSAGALSIGEVAAAVAMTLRLNTMTFWIMWMTVRMFEHFGTIREGLESIAVPHTVTDCPAAPALVVRQAGIRFEGLSHHYGKGSGGLDRIDLAIEPGEKVGLVGRSGAGKSSLVNLLLRFRDAEAGRILIDDQDIAGVTQDSLRHAIGMVTQDSSLLHRSVRANILYGAPDASQAAMVAAAKRAEAHDFVLGLRDPKGRTGYDAHVGERGVKLSGGQRQRIALARVILKDAPILVLDEATSALDSEVEAAIQATLYGVMEGKTVIAIAHRLSTIAHMDRIVVLDAGRVAEQGTHADLLARGGLYARFWNRQSGGFIDCAPALDAAE